MGQPIKIEPTEQQRQELRTIVARRSESAGLVRRARVELLSDAGVAGREISLRLGPTPEHVSVSRRSGPPAARYARNTIAAIALLLMNCRSSRNVLGDGPETGALSMEPEAYLAEARAVLSGRAPTQGPESSAGLAERAFITIWTPGAPEPFVSTGTGQTTLGAIEAAARAAASKIDHIERARIEVGIVRDASATISSLPDEVAPDSLGLEGVLATGGGGTVGFVLPQEIVRRSLFHGGPHPKWKRAEVRALLARRAGVPETAVEAMQLQVLVTNTFVESLDHRRVWPTLHGMVWRREDVTSRELRQGAAAAANYLARNIDSGGRFLYLYDAVNDAPIAKYDWLRHAGATFALLEAYEAIREPRYLAAAESALDAMRPQLGFDRATEGLFLANEDAQEQQKSGGAGLALVAFAEHDRLAGRPYAHLDTMRSLARFLVGHQYPDGHFRSNDDVARETGRLLKPEPPYYQGEAALGLTRLYALLSAPEYLRAARDAANWIVRARTFADSELDQDHWSAYVFDELYRIDPTESYRSQVAKTVEAIRRTQRTSRQAPTMDWGGTFGDARTAPACTRLEAYTAALDLFASAHQSDPDTTAAAREVARATLNQQFNPENAYWLPNPDRAMGGVRQSLTDNVIRVDYVQHAICAWLHLARELARDSGEGPR